MSTLSGTAARVRVSSVGGGPHMRNRSLVRLIGRRALLAQYEKTCGEVCKALANTAERDVVAELANEPRRLPGRLHCWNCTCGYTSQSGWRKGKTGCTTSSLG